MKMFDADKTRLTGLLYAEKTDNMLTHFHLIPERHGQMDGWMDGQTDNINIAHQCADAR